MADDDSLTFRDEDSLRFLHGVSSRDELQRIQALETIVKKLDGWIEGYGSPKDPYLILENNHHPVDQQLDSNFRPLVQEHLPDILRLCATCPFKDVTDKLSEVLEDLKVIKYCSPCMAKKTYSHFVFFHAVIHFCLVVSCMYNLATSKNYLLKQSTMPFLVVHFQGKRNIEVKFI